MTDTPQSQDMPGLSAASAAPCPRTQFSSSTDRLPSRPQCLDDREIATVLAALRQFQRAPHHGAEHFGDIAPLDSDEIDTLCEQINSTDPGRCRHEPGHSDGACWSQFAAVLAAADVQLRRLTAPAYWCADCSCLFVPQIETDAIYPDRAVPIGILGNPATDHDCACHTLPHEWTSAHDS